MIKVTVLGNASAKPTVTSHPSAQVVNVNEQYYLVDAGDTQLSAQINNALRIGLLAGVH